MRKGVTIDDLLIAGAYYRLLKDVAMKFEIHLANNVFTKEESNKVYTLVDKIKNLECEMGFESNLFKFIENNSDDRRIEEVKGYEKSVFYGSVEDVDVSNPVNFFVLGYLIEQFPFVPKGIHLDHYVVEASKVVESKPKKWKATAEGNVYAANYLETILMNLYERDHKEDIKND